jgi:hypothetical protein
MEELDESHFRPLLDYLCSTKQPDSQILGLAHRRGFPPDISKRSWTDPRLFYLVMKFAILVSPLSDPGFSAIQIIRGEGKLDGHNKGSSWVVRFGAFTEGGLVLKTPTDTEHNIRHRPIIFNPKETEHYFKEAKGDAWTIIFYNVTSKIPAVRKLSDYEAVCESGKWSIAWYRAGEPTLYLSKKSGLPFLSKKKEAERWSFLGAQKKSKPEAAADDPKFSAAQNLMLRSAAAFNTE